MVVRCTLSADASQRGHIISIFHFQCSQWRSKEDGKIGACLKVWEGEKYFKAGERIFMEEVTQRMGETADGRKNFKLTKRSSKIYRVIGKKAVRGRQIWDPPRAADTLATPLNSTECSLNLKL